MTRSCVIVEDEPLARERAQQFIARIGSLEIAAVFESAVDAIEYLQREPIDIIFLDISMRGMTGIELLEKLQTKAAVILTTAHHDYAQKAYDLNVIDYLLKPYSFDRFAQAVGKATAFIASVHTGADELISIKTENRIERVKVNDILFIEGMRDYRRLHTSAGRIMTLKTFGEFENELDPARIIRVHKSFMVAPAHVNTFSRDAAQIGSTVIPVSNTYRKSWWELVNRLGFVT